MLLKYVFVLCLVFLCCSSLDAPTFEVKFLRTKEVLSQETECEVLSVGPTQRHKMLKVFDDVWMEGKPQIHSHDHDDDEHENEAQTMYLFKLFSHNKEQLIQSLSTFCPKSNMDNILSTKIQQPFADEIIPIIQSGPSSNRIDVVFMGDGYTEGERERFLEDIKRLTVDMWNGVTFASYLPLFNVWGLYRPSVQSGIGVGGVPRNTAFGLYRDGTELRGVYTSKASTARSACAATGFCDFPSLIGNDAFYGGLGGEFTISTASHTSGTIVLRHEFGHNFGSVGEEYNGGTAYFGANIATATTNIGWPEWLTEPNVRTAQQSVQRLQSYAWYDLANGARSFTFSSDGTWARSSLKFSVSGCEAPGSLTITLDGRQLLWNTTGLLDRQFYEYSFNTPFASGTHTLTFAGTRPTVDQIRQLCNLELIEYKAENLYKMNNSYIGIYPTVASGGRIYYRSNNELCLMRNMSSTHFCDVCRENMWHQFLNRISLIDNLFVEKKGAMVNVTLNPIHLANLRPVPIAGERYTITWMKNGSEQASLANKLQWEATTASSVGPWSVRIQFHTPEVRKDPNNLLVDTHAFTIQA